MIHLSTLEPRLTVAEAEQISSTCKRFGDIFLWRYRCWAGWVSVLLSTPPRSGDVRVFDTRQNKKILKVVSPGYFSSQVVKKRVPRFGFGCPRGFRKTSQSSESLRSGQGGRKH